MGQDAHDPAQFCVLCIEVARVAAVASRHILAHLAAEMSFADRLIAVAIFSNAHLACI